MARIIHYSPGMRLELGGVVRAVLDSSAILAARGHDVTLITYDAPDLPAHWDGRPGTPRVVYIPAAKTPNSFISRQAFSICREHLTPGSVLHLHTPWTASNLQVARAARRLRIPYIVTLHGMLNEWPMERSRLKKLLYLMMGGRKFLHRARFVHFTAAGELAQSHKWIPRCKPVVLPYLIDLSAFENLAGPDLARQSFGIDANVPTLLFLSRLHVMKGLDVLIAAAAILRDRNIPFTLLVAGTGDRDYTQQLQAQVAKSNLAGNVRFLGMVRGNEKLSLYQAADIFVLPTRHENFGLVLAEALASGTTVVTTRQTNIHQDVETAGGIIADSHPEAFADAIVELLKDRAALHARGLSGRKWVFDHWSAEKLAPQYERMNEDALS